MVKTLDADDQFARRTDTLMMMVLWLLLLFSFALSSLHDTLRWSVLIGIPTALIPTVLGTLMPGTLLTRLAGAVAFMVFSGLHIHQGNGLSELHFGIFVLLAMLLCYQDWRVIVTAAGTVALHHLSFNYLQELGYGVICFTKTGLSVVFIHAAYVVVEAAALCYIAVMLRRASLQGAELEAKVDRLMGDGKGVIDLGDEGQRAHSRVGKSFEGALGVLRSTMDAVRGGADALAMSSQEIAQENLELSRRTEHQAGILQETSSSMAELTATVRQNADTARQANGLATEAAEVARKGGSVVTDVVVTMEAINASAKRIADIISVIDGIAFQTNILALNAAVEAARAGEQGRGFAVVATEVRSLAQRSASAAKDIKTLIDDSVHQVGEGTKLVHHAGVTMTEVVDSVGRVRDLIKEIDDASNEQAAAIALVNKAAGQMDEVTRQNAALVVQVATAADSMQSQAAGLAASTRTFKTGPATLSTNSRPAALPRRLAGTAAPGQNFS